MGLFDATSVLELSLKYWIDWIDWTDWIQYLLKVVFFPCLAVLIIKCPLFLACGKPFFLIRSLTLKKQSDYQNVDKEFKKKRPWKQ